MLGTSQALRPISKAQEDLDSKLYELINQIDRCEHFFRSKDWPAEQGNSISARFNYLVDAGANINSLFKKKPLIYYALTWLDCTLSGKKPACSQKNRIFHPLGTEEKEDLCKIISYLFKNTSVNILIESANLLKKHNFLPGLWQVMTDGIEPRLAEEETRMKASITTILKSEDIYKITSFCNTINSVIIEYFEAPLSEAYRFLHTPKVTNALACAHKQL